MSDLRHIGALVALSLAASAVVWVQVRGLAELRHISRTAALIYEQVKGKKPDGLREI